VYLQIRFPSINSPTLEVACPPPEIFKGVLQTFSFGTTYLASASEHTSSVALKNAVMDLHIHTNIRSNSSTLEVPPPTRNLSEICKEIFQNSTGLLTQWAMLLSNMLS
jgi:hypothetical protein